MAHFLLLQMWQHHLPIAEGLCRQRYTERHGLHECWRVRTTRVHKGAGNSLTESEKVGFVSFHLFIVHLIAGSFGLDQEENATDGSYWNRESIKQNSGIKTIQNGRGGINWVFTVYLPPQNGFWEWAILSPSKNTKICTRQQKTNVKLKETILQLAFC